MGYIENSPVIQILSSLLGYPKHRFCTGYICYTMLLLLHSIEINLIFVLSTWISKQYGFSHDILYVNLAVDQTLLYTHATRIVVVYLCSRVGVGPVRPLPLPKMTLPNWSFLLPLNHVSNVSESGILKSKWRKYYSSYWNNYSSSFYFGQFLKTFVIFLWTHINLFSLSKSIGKIELWIRFTRKRSNSWNKHT